MLLVRVIVDDSKPGVTVTIIKIIVRRGDTVKKKRRKEIQRLHRFLRRDADTLVQMKGSMRNVIVVEVVVVELVVWFGRRIWVERRRRIISTFLRRQLLSAYPVVTCSSPIHKILANDNCIQYTVSLTPHNDAVKKDLRTCIDVHCQMETVKMHNKLCQSAARVTNPKCADTFCKTHCQK